MKTEDCVHQWSLVVKSEGQSTSGIYGDSTHECLKCGMLKLVPWVITFESTERGIQ